VSSFIPWLIAFPLGAVVGALAVWFALRGRESDVRQAREQLRDAFQALAAQVLQTNSDEFLKRTRSELETLVARMQGDWSLQREEVKHLVQPLQETLKTLDAQVQDIEKKREGAYGELRQQLASLGGAHTQLQTTATQLVEALKSSSARGRWGEVQLRRVVELAMMVEHVDFQEQFSTDEGRPDLIVHLPNRGVLPVDAKAPMAAFLEAMGIRDEAARRLKSREHAKAMRERIRKLGEKKYWQQFERAPEFVVMFVPNEAALAAAFETDGDLLEDAIRQGVLVATPLTLLALLKTVAYGWQQQRVAENARTIAEQGKALYDRLLKFLEHLEKTGRGLGTAVESFNAAVGSLNARLLPAAREFREAGGMSQEPIEPKRVEQTPAPVRTEETAE